MFKRKNLLVLAGIMVFLGGARMLFPNSDQNMHPLLNKMENPLPPCPNKPNCIRETRVFSSDRKQVFEAAFASIQRWNGWLHRSQIVWQSTERGEITATFRIGIFTDDFQVALTEQYGQVYVHVRSASRLGHGDLGVNSRRVHTYFQYVKEILTT
ncbi:MAG: DUF1499 domain-containing protein [Bacteroidetes Order II. Incertae sedis bacterium]|nr:DUF1499 domain-containing protein [Bacteroidetes Order II. bacterium]